jgi:hypothetical protein
MIAGGSTRPSRITYTFQAVEWRTDHMPTLVVDGWSPKMLQRSGFRVVSLSIIQLFLFDRKSMQTIINPLGR